MNPKITSENHLKSEYKKTSTSTFSYVKYNQGTEAIIIRIQMVYMASLEALLQYPFNLPSR